MTRHTKGPWTATHISGNNFAVQEFNIRGMFGPSPNVSPIFNRDTSAIDGVHVFVSPEDGRLIAAAPDLLATLKALLRRYPANATVDDLYHVYGQPIADDIAAARAAVGKAEQSP